MNGTWLLIGTAIGFAAAALYVYRRGQHQINQHQPWPLESDGIDIPAWVNQGNQIKVIDMGDLMEAIDFAIWEQDMERKDRS